MVMTFEHALTRRQNMNEIELSVKPPIAEHRMSRHLAIHGSSSTVLLLTSNNVALSVYDFETKMLIITDARHSYFLDSAHDSLTLLTRYAYRCNMTVTNTHLAMRHNVFSYCGDASPRRRYLESRRLLYALLIVRRRRSRRS